LIREETLGLKFMHLPQFGFGLIDAPFDRHPIPTADRLRVDYSEPGTMTLFKTAFGQRIALDRYGFFMAPVMSLPGDPYWRVEATLDTGEVEDKSLLSRFWQTTHQYGGVLVLTSDLETYWTKVYEHRTVSEWDIQTGNNWAAWIPLGDFNAALATDKYQRTWRYRLIGRHRAMRP